MPIKQRLLCYSLILSNVLLLSTTTHAYVCNQVPDNTGKPSGSALGWFTDGKPLTYAFNHNTLLTISAAQITAIRQSFQVWQNANTMRPNKTQPCATSSVVGLTFVENPNTIQDSVGYNYVLSKEFNENLLIFHSTNWPYPSTPVNSNTATADIVALTTTTFNQLTGEIFDADIEFNSANFTFTTGDTQISTDMMNTATHEIGHFLGFAHSPDPNSTMYFQTQPGETIKRYLTCDDAAGLLLRYPAGSTSIGYCNPPTPACGNCAKPGTLTYTAEIDIEHTNDSRGGGCSCNSTASTNVCWLGLAGLTWVWRRLKKSL